MDNSTISKILVSEYGYSEYEASITANDLHDLNPKLQDALQEWLLSRREVDVAVDNVSVKDLMEKKRLTYPAALIALDWLLADPDTAKAELFSDIKHVGW